MKKIFILTILYFYSSICFAQNAVSKLLIEKNLNLDALAFLSLEINLSNADFLKLIEKQNHLGYYVTKFSENGIVVKNEDDSQFGLYFYYYGKSHLAIQQIYGVNQKQALFEYRNNEWIYNDLLDQPYIQELINPNFEVLNLTSETPYLYFQFNVNKITLELNDLEIDRYIHYKYKLSDEVVIQNIISNKMEFTFIENKFIKKKIPLNKHKSVSLSSTLYEMTEDGPGLYNFTCPLVASIQCSSVLAQQGNIQYLPKNLIDDNNTTAWSEGIVGNGVGSSIEFTIIVDRIISPSFLIENGYAKNDITFKNNNRVKSFLVYINDKESHRLELLDTPKPQEVNLFMPWLKLEPVIKKGDKIKFVIEDVYKGIKYDDTLLSTFVILANCG